jgi:hypothetical protein
LADSGITNNIIGFKPGRLEGERLRSLHVRREVNELSALAADLAQLHCKQVLRNSGSGAAYA